MKLTPTQIDQLFIFTRQHFVEYYDLQLELVDHLANAIEQKWIENPKLTFDEALNLEFKKFGVFGFQDVIEKKHATMAKTYNRFVWQNIKEFFTFSTTIITFSIIFLLFQLFSVQNLQDYALLFATLLFFLIVFYASHTQRKFKKQRQKQNGKKWLLEEIIMYHGNSGWAFMIVPQILLRMQNIENVFLRLAASCFFALVSIYLYIILVKMPKKTIGYLTATYPEYKLEKL